MGVDLEVMFAATVTAEEVFALPDRLNTTFAVAAACSGYYEHMKRFLPGLERKEWRWHELWPAITSASAIAEIWQSRSWGNVPLSGIPGLLWLEPDQITSGANSTLRGFATDYQGCQTPIRRVCRAIANMLRTDRVLYLPDSGECPPELFGVVDAPFDEALARLAAWRPPVSEIGALAYGHALRVGYHYADGALRRSDGTPVPEEAIWRGRDWVSEGGIVRYIDGRLVPAEELARPELRSGFAYYVDDFRDLA